MPTISEILKEVPKVGEKPIPKEQEAGQVGRILKDVPKVRRDPLGAEISSLEPTIGRSIATKFRNPKKEGEKATLALVDAAMNNISPSQAMRLRPQIDKMESINPARAKLRGDLKTILGQNFNTGYAQINLGLWGAELLKGNDNEEVWSAIDETKKAITPIEERPYPETLAQEFGGAAAEMIPFLAESAKAGAWRGMMLAGGTWLLGSTTGTAGFTYPLIPKMYAVGQTSASLEFVGEVEAGLAYVDMLDYTDPKTGEKINPNVARAAAFGVGSINGLLELAQLNTLIKSFPGGKKILRGIINETVKETVETGVLRDLLGRTVTSFGTVVAKETAQEVAQESTNIVADIFARKITNRLDETDLSLPEKNEIINRLEETAIQSAKAFTLIGLPGPAISAVTGIRQTKAEQESAKEERERARKVIKATTFNQIKAQQGLPVPEFDVTPEDVQEFVETPEKSKITDEQLDEIIGDEANEDELIERLISEVEGVIEVPAEIGRKGLSIVKKEDRNIPETSILSVSAINANQGLGVRGSGEAYLDSFGNFILDGKKYEVGETAYLHNDKFYRVPPKELLDEIKNNVGQATGYLDGLIETMWQIRWKEPKLITVKKGEEYKDIFGISVATEDIQVTNDKRYENVTQYNRRHLKEVENFVTSPNEKKLMESLYKKELKDNHSFVVGGMLHLQEGQQLTKKQKAAIENYSASGGRLGRTTIESLGREDLIKEAQIAHGIKIKPAEERIRLAKGEDPAAIEKKEVRTLRGAIKEMGGIDFLNFKGELKDMTTAVKFLAKKGGTPIDLAERTLKETGWLREDESLIDVLRDDPDILRRAKIADIEEFREKAEEEITEQERRVIEEEERAPDEPPPGTYETMNAEDLPVGETFTIIEGTSEDGWDEYKVIDKDPFGVTLEDGEIIELSPLDKIQVRVGEEVEPIQEIEEPAPLEPFDANKIQHVGVKEAAQSGLISTDEAAVIDGIMQNFPEEYRAHFEPRFSEQQFAPSDAQLKAHGFPEGEQIVRGVLLSEDVQGLKDDTRNLAVMFSGSNLPVFFHEFGEFAYRRLLTPAEKKYVGGLKGRKKSGKSANEYFSDELRNYMVRAVEGKESIYPPKLTALFEKVAETIKDVWQRLRWTTPTPALDSLFKEILKGQREVLVDKKAAPKIDRPKPRIRRITWQALTAEERQERNDLRDAIKFAARNARIAFREGNKEGLATEKARMKAIVEKGKQRKKLKETASKTRKNIIKELKVAVPKKDKAGKIKGKLGPERHRILTNLYDLTKQTQKQADAMLNERLVRYQTEIPTIEESFENRILEIVSKPIARVTEADVEFWTDTLNQIIAFKGAGKFEEGAKALLIAEERAQNREHIINVLGGLSEEAEATGRRVKETDLAIKKRIRNALFAGGFQLGAVQDWDSVLDILSFEDVDTAPGESIISQIGNVFEEQQAEKEGGMLSMEETQKLYMEAFGLESESELITRYEQDAVEQDLGRFETTVDKDIDLKITRAEARKRVMEFLDPTLHEVFFADKENGGKMGYTHEIVDAIDSILTEQDKDYIQKQMEFYQKYYETINEVYKEMYGVNLPQNKFYSPISREGVKKEEEMLFSEFIQDAPFRGSAATAGALKGRVRNMNTITLQSDNAALTRHAMEMEHFKAWAQKIRDLNAIFGNEEVTRAISENFGKNVVKEINSHIQDFARGKIDDSQNYSILDKWRINYTRSVLAVKASLFVKQLTSMIAFSDTIPVKDWAKHFIAGLSSPKKMKAVVDELYGNSTYLQERWKMGSIERDIKAASQTDEYQKMILKPSYINRLMFLVKIGDMGAIIFGGYPVYKTNLDRLKAEGLSDSKSQKEAIKIFEMTAQSSQQSSDLSKLSRFQKGSSLYKLFTMFKTSPLQYLRKEISALRNVAAGRIGAKQFFKTMLIYHFILPMLFQWVSDLFPWGQDDDEEGFLGLPISKSTARVMILGNFNGIFIFGDLMEWLLSQSLGLYSGDVSGVPPAQIVKDFERAISEIDPDVMTEEDFLQGLRAFAGSAGGATGLPLKQVVDIGTGFSDILSGEYEKGMAEIAGWSPYIAEKRTEE